jgi:type I toxin-antitoxin system toxin SymE
MRSLGTKCSNHAGPASDTPYPPFPIAEDLKLSELLESTAGRAVAGVLERRARREEKSERARRARAAGRRSGTVCGRWTGSARVPDLRLSGRWLRAAGFDLEQAYEVEVRSGRLMIRAV